MDDNTIISVLNQNGSDFAKSLVASHDKWGRWTPKQRACAEEIVRVTQAPKQEVASAALKGIVDLFARPISRGMKRPKLSFILDTKKLTISMAPAMKGSSPHPNAGCFYVKYEGLYCGKITPSGLFQGRHGFVPQNVMDFMEVFAKDPLTVGSEYGRKSGCCCFCGMGLSDGRSLIKGYGPVCANHWELPWGDEKEENMKRSEQSDIAPDVPIIQLRQAAHGMSEGCREDVVDIHPD